MASRVPVFSLNPNRNLPTFLSIVLIILLRIIFRRSFIPCDIKSNSSVTTTFGCFWLFGNDNKFRFQEIFRHFPVFRILLRSFNRIVFPLSSNTFNTSTAISILSGCFSSAIFSFSFFILSMVISQPSTSPPISSKTHHLLSSNSSWIYSSNHIFKSSVSCSIFPVLSAIPPPLVFFFFTFATVFLFSDAGFYKPVFFPNLLFHYIGLPSNLLLLFYT